MGTSSIRFPSKITIRWLTAIFKGAYDEHDWMKPNANKFLNDKNGRYLYRYLPHVPAEEIREWEVRVGKHKAEIASLKKSLEDRTASLKQKHFEESLAKLPEVLRSDVRQAVETAADNRDEIQKYLSEKFSATLFLTDEQLKESDEDFKKTAEETTGKITSLEKNSPPEPMIRALWDRGEPSPTYLLRRGDYLMPGRLVEPAALSVLSTSKLDIKPPWPGAKKTGRRLALAKWLVRPDHPLTARVMVNTIWKHHFQHGIVKSMDNFGHTGSPPTHPELLDWLAREFTRCDWSIKDMHRLIMTSSTYRQMSTVTPAHEQFDLDNDLLSRFPMKRMEAEVLWDTLLLISGCLDETPFGVANGVKVRPDGLVYRRRHRQGLAPQHLRRAQPQTKHDHPRVLRLATPNSELPGAKTLDRRSPGSTSIEQRNHRPADAFLRRPREPGCRCGSCQANRHKLPTCPGTVTDTGRNAACDRDP